MPAVNPAKAFSLVSTFDDGQSPVRRSECQGTCGFARAAQWHHVRLMAVENDQDALMELFELALTWHELEYSTTSVIPPDRWMAFVDSHCWADPERIERIFSIATDVVMMVGRKSRPPLETSQAWFPLT
jgi:hypothetical protein